MIIRRSLAALLAAGLVLTAGACSDDGSDEGSGSTTTAPAETTASTTTTTLGDDEYSQVVEETKATLVTAGSDLCQLSTVNTAQPPQPANPAQVEQFLDLYRTMYGALADTLEADDPTSAEALRNGGEALMAAGEEAGFSLEFLGPDSQPEALSSPEFTNAIAALQTKFTEDCPQQAGGATGGETPEGSSGPPETTAPAEAPEG